jgi:hypothetical protein
MFRWADYFCRGVDPTPVAGIFKQPWGRQQKSKNVADHGG